MAYWHIQMYKDREENEEKRLLTKLSIIGVGDLGKNNTAVKQFKKTIKIGDIVLVRRGKRVISLVKVVGEIEDSLEDDYSRLDWFRYRRKVKVLDWANNKMENFPQAQGSLQRLVNKDTKSYQYINDWYTKIIQKDYNNKELIEGTYKLKELYIQDNQKIFQDFKIDFTSDGKNPLPIIVIAGKNGTGKTTLLEYLSNFEIKNSDYIEIFSVREEEGLELDFDNENELIVDTLYINDGIKGIQSLKRNFLEHIEYLPVYSSKIKDVKDFILQKHRKRSRELDSITKATKEIGNFIEKIFKDMDLSFSLVDVDDTDRDNEKVTFKNKSGKEFDIDNLSTGEKTLLSKVLYLYFKDIKNRIILIDEPELSLHPAWQNRVLKLYENFAKENNCQIIIATHSPHIIGSAKNEYLRFLIEENNKIVVKQLNNSPLDRDVNTIIKTIMGAEYMPKELIKLHERYRKLFEDGKIKTDEAKDLEQEILKFESPNSSFFQGIAFDKELMG